MSLYEAVQHSSARVADAFVLALILTFVGIIGLDVYAALHVL